MANVVILDIFNLSNSSGKMNVSSGKDAADSLFNMYIVCSRRRKESREKKNIF